jgi:NADH:ubiquinone oxidoreductase subunit F (NADH-binding)
LDGKPSNINNVKTLASIPVILERGADWFSSIGTEKSKGTAVFALTGKIANSGLVEVPMGTPLSRIIYEIGGGIPRNKRLKAVQTGGPSGGCIPAHFIDLPVDYESLAQLGSIMGSGGMVVMDETTCMVEVARYFLSFTQTESCGKCTPCRLGTRQMLEILTRITEGRGSEADIDTLLAIARTVKECSLCGLGQTSPNPVLSTIEYFRDEYDAQASTSLNMWPTSPPVNIKRRLRLSGSATPSRLSAAVYVVTPVNSGVAVGNWMTRWLSEP